MTHAGAGRRDRLSRDARGRLDRTLRRRRLQAPRGVFPRRGVAEARSRGRLARRRLRQRRVQPHAGGGGRAACSGSTARAAMVQAARDASPGRSLRGRPRRGRRGADAVVRWRDLLSRARISARSRRGAGGDRRAAEARRAARDLGAQPRLDLARGAATAAAARRGGRAALARPISTAPAICGAAANSPPWREAAGFSVEDDARLRSRRAARAVAGYWRRACGF